MHADLKAVFDEEPPRSVVERIEESDDGEEEVLENSFRERGGSVEGGGLSAEGSRSASGSRGGGVGVRRRRLSSVWQG